MYMKAAEEGVDAMLNLYAGSVGEVADSAQDVAKYIGVPIVPRGRGDVRGGLSARASASA